MANSDLGARLALALMLAASPGPVLARGAGSGPTPTCRKGCKPLSPEQVRQLRRHPSELPPQIGGGPPR